MESKIHTYESDEITVTYDIKRCIHAAECVRGLPMVFKPELRRWIQPENSTGERIADVIERCPTGALHYEMKTSTRKESHCADAGALPRSHFVTEHTEKLILKINLKPTDRIHHHVGQITTHHRFPLVGFSRRVGSIRCPYHRGYVDTSAV